MSFLLTDDEHIMLTSSVFDTSSYSNECYLHDANVSFTGVLSFFAFLSCAGDEVLRTPYFNSFPLIPQGYRNFAFVGL